MPFLMNAGGAGGLAQGIQAGTQLGLQVRESKRAQDLAKLQKEAHDFRMKEQKMRLDQMKFEMQRQEKMSKAQDVLSDFLQGQQTIPGQLPEMQAELQQGSPRGSQMMPTARAVDPTFEGALPLAMQAGPQGLAALQAATTAGTLRTPAFEAKERKDQREAESAFLDDQIKILSELRAQAGEQRASALHPVKIADIQSQMQARQLGMKKTLLDMKATKQGMNIKFNAESMKRTFVEKVQKLAAIGDQKAGAALDFVAAGDMKSAVNAMYRPFAGMSEAELARQVMLGNPEAIEAWGLKMESKGKGQTLSVMMGKDGVEGITLGEGGTQAGIVKRKEIENYLQETAGLDYTRGLIDMTRDLILQAGDQNVVGPAATMSRLASNLNALRQGYTKAEKGAAARYERDAFSEQAEASTRVHSMLVMLAAIATRDTLGEVGVLTNQDIKRGESIVGASSSIFAGPNTNENVLIRLDQVGRAIDLKEKTIMKRQERLSNVLTPERAEAAQGKPFFERAQKRAGMSQEKPAAATAPAAPAVQEIEKRIGSMSPEDRRKRLEELRRKQGVQ